MSEPAEERSASSQPFAYVIISLVSIFIIGSIAMFIHVRARRRNVNGPYRMWPPSTRTVGPDGRVRIQHGRRSPWTGTHSEEGFNELGEAPPPYETSRKKTPPPPPPPPPLGGGEDDYHRHGNELSDLEAGARPPEYGITEPAPAVTTDSWRTA